ncbi:DJ-1/PfpI family protein (plasmid) [Latilactobacillus sp. 5-91]|uniref:DJ-1/PfpI family protein n=1 Tax=Latilactobacillus sp. 5-91 TaxID=3410924 RepID=UPI003C788549
MKTIYIYVLDTLADWELGFVTAELNSRRFFKEGAPVLKIKTVSHSKQPITTMGGIEISPDCLIEDIDLSENSILLLPGADTWNNSQNNIIISKAQDLLSVGGKIGGICGATVALANGGLLNETEHTSNGPGFLDMFSPAYHGQKFYLDQPSVCNNNIITASSTGALMWTKQIIDMLDVFEQDTLEAWYNYFNTGDSYYYFELIQTLPSSNKI